MDTKIKVIYQSTMIISYSAYCMALKNVGPNATPPNLSKC